MLDDASTGISAQSPKQYNKRSRGRRIRLIGILVVVSFLLAGWAYVSPRGSVGGTNVGSLAPDFSLVGSDGTRFQLSQFRGEPVVLYFMTASFFCQPCNVETSDQLVPLYHSYSSKIQIISIEVLASSSSNANLNSYKAFYGSPWIYALDTAGVVVKYQVETLSTVVIVDSEGVIRYQQIDPAYSTIADILTELGV